jgi:hypothetical protein
MWHAAGFIVLGGPVSSGQSFHFDPGTSCIWLYQASSPSCVRVTAGAPHDFCWRLCMRLHRVPESSARKRLTTKERVARRSHAHAGLVTLIGDGVGCGTPWLFSCMRQVRIMRSFAEPRHEELSLQREAAVPWKERKNMITFVLDQ